MTRRTPVGRMAEIRQQIPDHAFKVIEDKLLDGASANELAKVLTEQGYPVSASTIKAHRKRLKESDHD